MVDFSKRQAASKTEALNAVLCPMLDEAIAAKSRADYEATRGSGDGEVAKKRIGAGYIGTECARDLAFRYHKHPKEDRPSSVSKGELQRHAESGHWTEAKTAEWFALVGLEVNTCQRDKNTGEVLLDPWGKPKQIGWKAARDPATQQYRMAGEVDGVIVAVRNAVLAELIEPPTIWESKKATDKKWKKFLKEGVKKADPKYYGQLQTNMAYMGVKNTLFSMLNLDNMKYFFEPIAFDQAYAQTISDRAVRVLESDHAFQLPRIGLSEDDSRCKFCDFHGQCWKGLVIQPPTPVVDPTRPYAPDVPKLGDRPVFNPNFPVP